MVDLWRMACQQRQLPLLCGADALRRRMRQRLGKLRIAIKMRRGVAGHLPAGKQGAHIHIVLHKLRGHDHIAHPHVRGQPTGHTGKNQTLNGKTLHQHRRGGGSGHFADAAQGQHHFLPMEHAPGKGAPRMAFGGGVGQQQLQALLFFRQGANNGKGHGKRGKKRRRAESKNRASRNERPGPDCP